MFNINFNINFVLFSMYGVCSETHNMFKQNFGTTETNVILFYFRIAKRLFNNIDLVRLPDLLKH